MRARLPDVSGLWPAFWMRPQHGVYGGWPRSGEIDILEYAGPTPTSWSDRRIVHDLHWYEESAPGNNGSAGKAVRVTQAWLQDFHTFAVEWDADGFRWYVDGELTHQVTGGWSAPGVPAPAPFDQPFFITLNLQVGGWSGNPVASEFPDRFEIDWVRVYQ
jgi:beta-glucanase (GH16 family)